MTVNKLEEFILLKVALTEIFYKFHLSEILGQCMIMFLCRGNVNANFSITIFC